MLDSLSSAVSGLDAFQQQMDIIGNNIANLNTTGFKAARSDLTDSFSDTLEAATAASSSSNLGNNAMQVGTGVTTAAITNNWAQGAINPTGVASDLAINGNGFFTVSDPNGTQYVTQDGTFSLNSSGNLVTATGMQVLGIDGKAIVINNNSADTTATMQSYSISSTGVITVNLSDGTSFTRGQLGLQSFQDPQALVSAGSNLFTNMANAGPSAVATPGSAGLGTIQAGALELSNVDLSSEMAGLITAQRAFEANSKIITTSDELLQDVVNMKR